MKELPLTFPAVGAQKSTMTERLTHPSWIGMGSAVTEIWQSLGVLFRSPISLHFWTIGPACGPNESVELTLTCC